MIDQLNINDYASGAYFDVQLGGNPLGMSGRFTSVSGLGVEFEYETYTQGGSMYPQYFMKSAVPQTLVLEQGTITTTDSFSQWVSLINTGVSMSLNGTITLNNHMGLPMRSWIILGARITKYVGPSLDSNNPQLAVSRIEMMYNGAF